MEYADGRLSAYIGMLMRGDVADEGGAHDAAVARAGRARRQSWAEGPRHELLQHVVQDLAMGGLESSSARLHRHALNHSYDHIHSFED
jgi:hypothetical protein